MYGCKSLWALVGLVKAKLTPRMWLESSDGLFLFGLAARLICWLNDGGDGIRGLKTFGLGLLSLHEDPVVGRKTARQDTDLADIWPR